MFLWEASRTSGSDIFSLNVASRRVAAPHLFFASPFQGLFLLAITLGFLFGPEEQMSI